MSDATAADYGGFSNYGDGALWVDSYDASKAWHIERNA